VIPGVELSLEMANGPLQASTRVDTSAPRRVPESSQVRRN